MQHGVAVGVGNVRFQAGERSTVVEPEIKVFEPDFGVGQLHFMISLRNGNDLEEKPIVVNSCHFSITTKYQ